MPLREYQDPFPETFWECVFGISEAKRNAAKKEYEAYLIARRASMHAEKEKRDANNKW